VATETSTTRRRSVSGDSTTEAREEIERTEEAAVDEQTANRFDIRRVIGGLFVIYGVILTVVGFGASPADKHKAAGININLWTGLGMLAVGVLFVVWALWRPVGGELAEDDSEDEREPSGRQTEAEPQRA
jgi:hypothetical protein